MDLFLFSLRLLRLLLHILLFRMSILVFVSIESFSTNKSYAKREASRAKNIRNKWHMLLIFAVCFFSANWISFFNFELSANENKKKQAKQNRVTMHTRSVRRKIARLAAENRKNGDDVTASVCVCVCVCASTQKFTFAANSDWHRKHVRSEETVPNWLCDAITETIATQSYLFYYIIARHR